MITRRPPRAGTWKGCDLTVSPSTVTVATGRLARAERREDGASGFVGRRTVGHAITGDRHRRPDDVVADCLLHDAHRHRAVRQVLAGQRHAVHLPQVGHLRDAAVRATSIVAHRRTAI